MLDLRELNDTSNDIQQRLVMLVKLMSIESMMPSDHLILCRPHCRQILPPEPPGKLALL